MAGLSIGGEPDEHSEDCLSLSVWTPGTDGSHRPVMVWVHGGGFTSGSGAGDLYRGGVLAREGDVVVVTINYRLGALGFLAHPALAAPDEPWLGGERWRGCGNWGLADQVAALAWVRDHIADFGGDPGNVTLFGESAGAMGIAALLAVPEARGLFHRAVVESGPPYWLTLDGAADRAERLAARLGVPLTREALARVPADDLVRETTALGASLRIGEGGLPLPVLPVIDGGLLGRPPEEAIAGGSSAGVPLMVGTTRDEAAFFAVGLPELSKLDDAGVARWVTRAGAPPREAPGLVAAYRAARSERGDPVTPRDLWVAIASDLIFRLPSVRLADIHARAASPGVGTFTYLFTWETPAFGGILGSCHALEIPFVFGTVKHPAVQLFSGGGDDAMTLSTGMRAAWLAFARSGAPSNGVSGVWPVWEPESRPTLVFGPWPEAGSGTGAGSSAGAGSGTGAGGGGVDLWRAVDRPRDEELVALARVVPRTN